MELSRPVLVEDLDLDLDFDINAAFQEAIEGAATDEELKLEEKVAHMEQIINEGSGELYRDFIDFRMMAAQIEAFCNHDHALSQSLQNSEVLSGFMSSHSRGEGHGHSQHPHDRHKSEDNSETDSKTGKKKKKKRKSWFGFYY